MSRCKKDTDAINLIVILQEIAKLMEGEDRQDVEFRLNLVVSQLGSVAQYITHDPELNPNARPYGSVDDEVHAFGQLFVQLLATALLREVDVPAAIKIALENWKLQDWRKSNVQNKTQFITGSTACKGVVKGVAFVDPDGSRLQELDGHILVTTFLTPDKTIYAKKAVGIVTDHGSVLCHAAIIAREWNIPCIVGTGNGTGRICDGQEIKLEAGLDKGSICFI